MRRTYDPQSGPIAEPWLTVTLERGKVLVQLAGERQREATCRRLELVFPDGTELCVRALAPETEEQDAERPD